MYIRNSVYVCLFLVIVGCGPTAQPTPEPLAPDVAEQVKQKDATIDSSESGM